MFAKVGMLEKAMDLPPVKDMLEKSKPILGYDILDICLKGAEQKLQETRYCQPAMFIGGLAGLEKLREERSEAVGSCIRDGRFVARRGDMGDTNMLLYSVLIISY